MRLNTLALALALGLAGCAHEQAPPSSGGIGTRSEATLEGAFDAVASGAQQTARAGGYIVERVNDDTVRVMREAGLERVAGGIGDAWIKTKIESKFLADPGVKVRDIHVSSDAGVVTLRGQVRNESEAVRAIEDALNVNGVVAVNAQLDYPGQNQANRRTYEK
jgi:osmotically-inducible protein OsmY